MYKSYLKSAFRNLRKYKGFSAINIGGLALGMAACLLILQYVSFQLSFDQFNKNVGDIYRVVNDRYHDGKLTQHGNITYSGIGKAMKDDYEEVVRNCRVVPSVEIIISYREKKLLEDELFYTDSAFLSMFDYPLLAGDKNSVLKKPYTVIISENMARKIFEVEGNDFSNVIGQALLVANDSVPYEVEAVCKNVPENSHLQFNMLISYPTLISNKFEEADHGFKRSNFWHYVQLKTGADYKKFNSKLDLFSKKHFDGNKVSGSDEKFYLQPLANAHLYSNFEYEIGVTGSASVVWGLLIVALFIVCIAWVNYINLSTSRAIDRAKEVGIRKVVGGSRKQLIKQFFTESVLINLISLSLAVIIVLIFQDSFNKLLQTRLSLAYLFSKGLSGYNILIGLVLAIIIGVIASGFYPAMVLSSFKPITVLKGKLGRSVKGIAFRKVLVVGQFSITVGLIAGSIIVLRQLRFMNKNELGFNMDQVLVIKPPMLFNWDSTLIEKTNTFKEELRNITHVKAAATSRNTPGIDLGRSFNVGRADSSTAARVTMRHTTIDDDFLDVYGIKLVAGRNFQASDLSVNTWAIKNILISETAAKLLDFPSPEAAIGKQIIRGNKTWTVIGVVNDYHQKSLRFAMEPMLFMPLYDANSEISVKISPADVTGTIAQVRKAYETFFPGNLFDYTFLDDRFNEQYKTDLVFSRVFTVFAALAILVACLGLFGLAMFSTIQRRKEIGIRKVFGASISSILLLLSKDFIKLVLIASLIALPLSWWVMNNWLENFAYRISISWWIFVFAGLISALFAFMTVSFQAMRAAIANPVGNLRSE